MTYSLSQLDAIGDVDPVAEADVYLAYGRDLQAEEILKSRHVINEILARHTGQPIERIAKDTERDRYLSALQAKEYGLVDDIIYKHK